MGEARGIYRFDEFEYKEIEIEDGMRWLQSAPDRIRRHRMGRFRLTFTDKDGWPIDNGAKAAVALRRHAFPLGTSLRTKRASAMDDNDYRWYLSAAVKHFWTGTIAQQMQWFEFEPSPGDTALPKREVGPNPSPNPTRARRATCCCCRREYHVLCHAGAPATASYHPSHTGGRHGAVGRGACTCLQHAFYYTQMYMGACASLHPYSAHAHAHAHAHHAGD
jgi:hypothetical protein